MQKIIAVIIFTIGTILHAAICRFYTQKQASVAIPF